VIIIIKLIFVLPIVPELIKLLLFEFVNLLIDCEFFLNKSGRVCNFGSVLTILLGNKNPSFEFSS